MRIGGRRFAVVAVALTLVTSARGAEPAVRTPQEWMQEFSRNWNEKKWIRTFRSRPNGYMRPLDDRGWRARMLALQGMVSHGKAAASTLLHTLANSDTPERILAAQALGFLSPLVPTDQLLHAAENDSDPAVRLYAIDALGMQGVADEKVNWNRLSKTERNRDAQKHLGYAIERKGKPLEIGVIETLKRWDTSKIDTAKLGRPAPDFELTSATGERIRLSQFRGKRAVVLVFIYGDT